jgi:glycerol-3-phosphate dehydrogenase (NAD(P)+)
MATKRRHNICVLGAGAMGTAMGMACHANGHRVTLWESLDPDYARSVRACGENKRFLPGVKIPRGIAIEVDEEACLKDADTIVLAVPSQAMREVLTRTSPYIKRGAALVGVAKGLEADTAKRMSLVVRESVPLSRQITYTVLSGPCHAEELARGGPCAMVAASKAPKAALRAQKLMMNDYLRLYTSNDLMGVELGGSLKNIIAIAAGVVDGLGLGDNSKAALLTRGLHEVAKLGRSQGAQAHTFAGLAGIGDLIVTSTSRHSRNRWFGEQAGKGKAPDKILASTPKVVEGVSTVKPALALARKAGIEMPIAAEVERLIFRGSKPKDCIGRLMRRSAKPEWI